MKYYAIQFGNRRGEMTAKLIIDTEHFPYGKASVTAYSRLYPYSEAGKMERFYMGPLRDTWTEAFEEVLG